jgi:lysozyme family protein
MKLMQILKKSKQHPKLLLGILLCSLVLPVTLIAGKTLASQQAQGSETESVSRESRIFQASLYFTLYFEGGFSDHPADGGGRTYRGITQSEYDSYRLRNSQGATMHPALAVVMFDTAVNFGINNAITFLQQALGLPQTGVFDAETLKAVKEANSRNTAFQIINERIIYRYQRVREKNSQLAFFHGWLSRDYSLWKYVEKIKVKEDAIAQSAPEKPEPKKIVKETQVTKTSQPKP